MSDHPDDAPTETITVTVRRDDALVLVMGPLDAAITGQPGSVMRLRRAIAEALRVNKETS